MTKLTADWKLPCQHVRRRLDLRCHAPPSDLPASATAFPYQSLLHLREMLTELDAEDGRRLAVVLALPPQFAGDLGALIQRRRQADRLTLAAVGGQFPALPDWSFLDAGGELGWSRIDVEADWQLAIGRACESSAAKVVLFWPAWAA